MAQLAVSLGKLKLPNPVLTASGAFGFGEEYQALLPLKRLGGIITKTITLNPREGNPPPRIAETDQGMLNSIGLENPGLNTFLRRKLPGLQKIGIPVIVSIAGDKPGEFAALCRRLNRTAAISAIELNISCPNLGKSGLIAQDARSVYQVVKAAKKTTRLPLITKLSPNVTDIGAIARAARDAGTNILSLVNTFFALAVDIKTQRPKLGNVTGGLSGPAIKPQALWMVRRVFKATGLPIIGMGGIMNTEDALEFILCGSSAVACGTANFVNPQTAVEILDGIKKYLARRRIKRFKQLIGALKK